MAKFATGSNMRTVPTRVDKPKLWFFRNSLNAEKANMCLRISTAWPVEEHIMNFPQETQTLAYARLNPDMGIPTLEIDDKVICGSDLIQKYLSEHYPGLGDRQAPTEAVDNFIKVMLQWDEGLWSYKHMPGGLGSMINKLKSLRLHENLLQALNEGSADEVLPNGLTILQAYTKKIAWVRQMEATTGCEITPQIEKQISQNDANLTAMMVLADDLLASSQPFLFGPNLTSADAFFMNVLFRLSQVEGSLEEQFKRHEPVRKYWEAVQATEEARVVTDYGKGWALRFMLTNGVPFILLGLKLGCLKIPNLPQDVEDGIQAAYLEREREYFSK